MGLFKKAVVSLLALLGACSGGCGAPLNTATGPGYESPEPTFYKLCYDSEGIGLQVTSCARPEEVVWSHMPLKYWADPYTEEAMAKASAVWEDWLGSPVFVPVATQVEADILVGWGGEHPYWLGVTYPRRDPRTHEPWMKVLMYTNALLADDSGVDTMAHELGHVLGLEHDPNDNRSLMYPNSGRWLAVLQPADLKALLDRYWDLLQLQTK